MGNKGTITGKMSSEDMDEKEEKDEKGSDKGFDVKSEINLYDGNKRLATYSLVGS